MPEHLAQFNGMGEMAVGQRLMDVVLDETLYGLDAPWLVQELLAQFNGDDLGQMLVFGDGSNLGLGQAAEVETIAVT
jgi:hypothetical protein